MFYGHPLGFCGSAFELTKNRPIGLGQSSEVTVSRVGPPVDSPFRSGNPIPVEGFRERKNSGAGPTLGFGLRGAPPHLRCRGWKRRPFGYEAKRAESHDSVAPRKAPGLLTFCFSCFATCRGPESLMVTHVFPGPLGQVRRSSSCDLWEFVSR